MHQSTNGNSVRRRSNMHEVAELAGVAISSVSRVLSKHPDVSPAMRERVLVAVDKLEYEPDFLAQSLRRGATLSVGFVVGDISNPLLANIVKGAESLLRAAGLSLLLMSSENNPDLDAAHIRFFTSRRTDGMLLSLASEKKRSTIDLLASLEVPLVVIDRELPARTRVSAVMSDHRASMRQAAAHLIQQGARRIAVVAGPLDVRVTRERVAGIREATRGVDVELTVDTGLFSPQHGAEATDMLLNGGTRPDALILASNQITVGALGSLKRHGLVPGRDLAVITCDEVPLQELLEPAMSSVTRDTIELGRVAAELLLDRINNESEPRTVVLPTHFVARASSTVAGSNPH